LKKQVIAIILLVLMLIVSACGNSSGSGSSGGSSGAASGGKSGSGSGANPETVKIGVLMTLTGPAAAIGEGNMRGLELFLEKHNYQFGNKKVELVVEDDTNNPQIALRKYRKLVDSDKVSMIVGISTSTILYALRDQIDSDKVVTLISNAGANGVSWSQKSDYIYRISFSNYQIGANGAQYYVDNLGKRIYIVATESPTGKEQVDSFVDAFTKAGGEVLKVDWVKSGTTDFATYMVDISKANPDVVYSFNTSTEGIRFAIQFQEFGLKDKIPLITQLSSDMAVTPEIVDAMDGTYGAWVYAPSLDNEANKRFVEEYRTKYNSDPTGGYEVYGYDAGQVIKHVLENAPSLKPEDMVSVLKSGFEIDSPRGPVVIDPVTHNPVNNSYIQRFVKNGDKLDFEFLAVLEKQSMPAEEPAQ